MNTNQQTWTTKQKKKAVKRLASEMLKDSYKFMLKRLDLAIESKAAKVSEWNPEKMPMILPKTIMLAILSKEAKEYDAKGTSFEKQVHKHAAQIGDEIIL